jgi:predicted RNA binding protein YcfA (HicA-like mRNA interferase family)
MLKLLAADGWVQTSQRGSHRQFEHPVKPGKITVPGHPGDEVPRGTLKSIRQQAGWKE